MKYSISYEIERYEVRLIAKSSCSDLGGNNFFCCEEDAVEFAFNYVKEHPDWTFKILRVEKAIVSEA
jgi:hypothetical protein